ncbi:hypothetical protein PAXRUDRAFT_220262 [Paxillus rubicundulus Ve08.2h10]|uniref:Uncharacterized protein n=1 Tax=Paxillus rubicundulus Ve08.2h10 TaxID=930991 RepID=A0A0D0EBE7_9AGAM|nr:hypothetical protein PAXRUDRAFT_220262 [Paxillus rubicundulus Ve08.2h10]
MYLLSFGRSRFGERVETFYLTDVVRMPFAGCGYAACYIAWHDPHKDNTSLWSISH